VAEKEKKNEQKNVRNIFVEICQRNEIVAKLQSNQMVVRGKLLKFNLGENLKTSQDFELLTEI
jgi:hypothetical protein